MNPLLGGAVPPWEGVRGGFVFDARRFFVKLNYIINYIVNYVVNYIVISFGGGSA